MGKKSKKAENCKKVVDTSILEASVKIETLAASQGIKVTDHYAVEKELLKVGSISSEKHFTRWGEVDGQRTLLVLCGDKLKSYPDYSTHFSSTKTIKV